MQDIILIIDVLAAAAVVGLVLLQQGKGADMGAAFGSGASQTLFGARGSANFLTRATAILAVIFFSANLALAWFATRDTTSASVVKSVTTEAPAKPDAAARETAPSVPEVPK